MGYASPFLFPKIYETEWMPYRRKLKSLTLSYYVEKNKNVSNIIEKNI